MNLSFQKLKNKYNSDKIGFFTLLIISIGCLIRFAIAMIAAPSGDGCWHLNVARFIAVEGRIPLFESLGRSAFARPPLYHILASVFYRAFSVLSLGEYGLKMVSPIFGSLVIIFSYFLFRNLTQDKKEVIWAVFFVSFLPLSMYFSSIPHIDILVSFFTLLTIFFLVKRMYFWTGISIGLAMLSKYSGPVLLLIIGIYFFLKLPFREFVRNTFLVVSVALAVSGAWFLRNWLLLGNPMWPMLRSFFGGYNPIEISYGVRPGIDLVQVFNIKWPIYIYLGFFGVPQGNPAFLSIIPYELFLGPIWILSTVIFFLPILLFYSYYKKEKWELLSYLWIGAFLLVAVIFLMLSGLFPRILLPAVPALALLWAAGLRKIGRYSWHFFFILVIIALGFTGIEFYKAVFARQQWNNYRGDFEWIRDKTAEDSLFLVADGQCFAYYFERPTITSYKYENRPELSREILEGDNVRYVWVNENFMPDPSSVYGPAILSNLHLSEPVYYNQDTGTRIYSID